MLDSVESEGVAFVIYREASTSITKQGLKLNWQDKQKREKVEREMRLGNVNFYQLLREEHKKKGWKTDLKDP